MKQLLLIFALIAGLTVQAQKSKVTTAKLDLDEGRLDKALENIEIGIQDEKAAIDPRSWYYRGMIYQAISEDNGKYKNLDTNAIDKAYESYLKALELDPDYSQKDGILLFGLDPLRVAYAERGEDARVDDN